MVAGLGLGLSGGPAALGSAALGPAQAQAQVPVAVAVAAHHPAVKPLAGHRIAGDRPASAFTAGPKHLRGPRGAVPGKARPVRPARVPRVLRVESDAMSRARRTGRPVVVAPLTTPTVEVTAHPDGLLSMTSNVFPVRVRVRGVWRAIDGRLRRTATGWAASVASVPVTFSPGGSGPLVTVANPAGQRVSLYWPAVLPRPVVSGSVALYRNVLPGVNLRMEATGTGYQEALVVRDAAAAANPRLRSLRYLVKAGSGLVLRPGPGSSLGVFAAGQLSFVAGQPLMWDSSHSQHFGIPAAADAPGSGRVTPLPVSYHLAGSSTATIKMAPPAAALTGPRVRYPLYIDPEITPGTAYYSQVMHVSNGFTKEWDTTAGATSQGSGITEIGDCGYSSCVWDTPTGAALGYTDRDYFRFDTTALEKRGGETATVYQVSFDDEQTGNSDGCTAQPSDIFSTTGGISSSTAWGGPQGSKIASASSAKGGGSSCPAGNVDYTSTASGNGALKTTLQGIANNGDSTVTLELRADSEGTEFQYKTYKDNPSLSVYYNFAPLTPDNLSVENQVTCDSSTTYTSLTKPKLFATGTDNNPTPLKITLNYTLQTAAGAAAGGTLASPTGASGIQQSTTPSTALANGTAYQFRASATNNVTDGPSNNRTGPPSPFYPFTVLTGPTVVPTISSSDYPQGQWGQPAGAPGVFSVGTGGASNIAGFAYSFDGGAGSEPVPSTTNCAYNGHGGLGTSVDSNGDGGGSTSGELALVQGSAAQIEIPKTISSGQHRLYVVSFDKAHNVSGETAYTFYVAPNYQAVSQPVTFINGSSLIAGATGAEASRISAQDNCCNEVWRGGSQLLFDGTALNQTFTVTISVPDAGWWQIGADMTKSFDYGQARIDLDQATSDINLGNTAAVPYDGYSAKVSLHYLDLGTQDLAAGSHTLTFTITGQNSGSSNFKTGINYITLSPTSRYEAESLPHGTPTAGTLAPQSQTGRGWSDNSQLLLLNSTLGARFTVTFSAPVESDYALGLNLATAADDGSVRIDLDPGSANQVNLDNTAASPLDEYSPTTSATYVFLGGVHLTAGTHVLQVTVVGTDPKSVGNRYNSGIDFVEAVPVTGATDKSLTSAMNNFGIATDNAASFGGNFDFTNSTAGGNLSLQAFRDAGITPGTASGPASTSFTVNGAMFSMPQLNSDSSGSVTGDNVIPDGQTIPLPPADQVQATDVALLAASTCGSSPIMTATLSYASGQPTQPQIGSVPDWLATGSAPVTLDHRDVGTAPDSVHEPHLYEVLLPANPLATLTSITLPVMPVTFLTDTHSCAPAAHVLHILAIGVRPVSAGQGPSGSVWTGGYAGPADTTVTPSGGSLNDTTLREVVATTALGSGGSLRIDLSNAGSMVPVKFDDVTVGAQSSGEGTVAAPVPVKFGGQANITLPAGGDMTSDPITAPAGWAGQLVVSMHVPATSPETSAPVHQTPNSSTFYASGDQTSNTDGTPFTTSSSGLLYLARVDIGDSTTSDGTVAVLGDQTSAQAPAGTFGNWTSDLPAALSSDQVVPPGSVVCVASTVSGTVTTASALSWLRTYVSAEPNLRDVIVSVGASDVLSGQPVSTIEANLSALVSAIQGYLVDNVPATQPVRVILATIAPLSLAATDSRELARQQVNTWITGNNTTAQVTSDIARAVADPANPNSVNPSLLSGGGPTAQYYTDIARQIATDISNAITNVAISGL